jgi:hypothetical protein
MNFQPQRYGYMSIIYGLLLAYIVMFKHEYFAISH